MKKKLAFQFTHVLLGLLTFLATTSPVFAHVGSPDIIYEGQAGPYKVLVIIRPPDVVPGIAEIIVRALSDGVEKVSLQPVYYRTGSEGAPKPELGERVPGDKSYFAGKLWLMEFGSASVNVFADGTKGPGTTLVPVPAMATARRTMLPGMGWLLAGLAVFLFVLAVTIIGASTGEGVLEPGQQVDSPRRWKVRTVMGFTALICVGLLFSGKQWWGSVDDQYVKYLYKPIDVEASIKAERGKSLLQVRLVDYSWGNRKISEIRPDHGKLMHLFLVHEPAMNAFVHLHPIRQDSLTFNAVLPALPSGKYKLFADIVNESGLSETFTASVEMPDQGIVELPISLVSNSAVSDTSPAMDPDDSWLVATTTTGKVQRLQDGATMTWENSSPLKTGEIRSLKFTVKASDGSVALLEPYLGMAGHAAVLREDGSVFIHLHPSGTISMAAQEAIASKVKNPAQYCAPASDSVSTKAIHERKEQYGGTISFPYSFPKPGHYRIWVQVKYSGKIQTGVFDAEVN